MADSLHEASRRVVATHLGMFKDSCVVSAVEAWRIWNDFPEQRYSDEFRKVLQHYGNEIDAVLADISLVMSQLVASPNGMLEDSFLLRHAATLRTSTRRSQFLSSAVFSSLVVKYGSEVVISDYGHSVTQSYGHMSCGRCESSTFMNDLNAYIARRRMSAL